MSHEASSILDLIRPGGGLIVVKLDRMGGTPGDVSHHAYFDEEADWVALRSRTRAKLVDPNIPGDMEKVHALQDGVKIEQPEGPGNFEIPKGGPVRRWTGAGRIKERRGFRVRLSDLVCAVRLIAQPTAGEQHFDQEGDEGAHCEKQRQTKGHE
jgi:hypothetical protein